MDYTEGLDKGGGAGLGLNKVKKIKQIKITL